MGEHRVCRGVTLTVVGRGPAQARVKPMLAIPLAWALWCSREITDADLEKDVSVFLTQQCGGKWELQTWEREEVQLWREVR